MTEYWVSQAQHFCEYCKIFIANNNASKAIHENGVRHKENVAKKLADMRKRNITEKREKEAMERDLERIEWKAKKQYEKDLAQQNASAATTTSEQATASGEGWVLDEKTGYYFDPKTKYTYDPNSGLYYSELTGRWTTQEEAVRASQEADAAPSASGAGIAAAQGAKSQNKPHVGTIKPVSGPRNGAVAKGATSNRVPAGSIQSKGVASSLAVKRKRESDAPKAVNAEEARAIAAREAAKKRLEERTKKNYGFTFD